LSYGRTLGYRSGRTAHAVAAHLARWRYQGPRTYPHPVLQDLCPRCGAEWLDDARACPACRFDQIGPRALAGGISRGIHLQPMRPALMALATLGLVIVAFGAGLRLRSPATAPEVPAAPAVTDADDVVPAAPLGRVLFAERLGESLELESYRTQFAQDDTIAWRAEFLEPPPTNELTVVIAWQSVRERMQLSEATVTLSDAELTMVASDEAPLGDLVPTAGLYSVAYYAGDMKLAEGIFEVLPPDR